MKYVFAVDHRHVYLFLLHDWVLEVGSWKLEVGSFGEQKKETREFLRVRLFSLSFSCSDSNYHFSVLVTTKFSKMESKNAKKVTFTHSI